MSRDFSNSQLNILSGGLPKDQLSTPTPLLAPRAPSFPQSTSATVTQDNDPLQDQQTIFMFTTVGYVGLHLVSRPLFRWGFRKLFPAKVFINNEVKKNKKQNEETDMDSNNNLSKNESKTKKLPFSERSIGVSGSYGEVLSTFLALSGISWFVPPSQIILYFGVLYPSLPFLLRFIDTINDKKSSIKLSRTIRLCGKSLCVTSGFAVSIMFAGYLLQAIPFFNIISLSFWDCLIDYFISDGPDM